MTVNFKYNKVLIFVSVIFTFISCNDPNEEIAEINPYEETNDWIFDVMDEVYLWTEEMPQTTSRALEPQEYFSSLIVPQDRFSRFVPDYDELISSLEGVSREAGYEMAFTFEKNIFQNAGENDVIGVVLYVKENSPAETSGLKRGDILTKINGTEITESNFSQLISQLSSQHEIDFLRYLDGNFQQQESLSLSTVVLAENPIFLNKTFTLADGRKVGYLVYNFFSSGPENGNYDEQLINVFADFKAAGIEELVLDLRYNSGGSLNSAVVLGSLIGKGVTADDIFSENRWNSLYQDYIENQEDGDRQLRRRFLDLPENLGDYLASSKVYIMVGSRTASASELVINGLLPYMDVEIIGSQTVGKNVGSVPIQDRNNPENTIGLLPIVFKVFNSAGNSDYEDGFIPYPQNRITDLTFPMKELGDPEEPLLAQALSLIGGMTMRMEMESEKKEKIVIEAKPIGSTIDSKPRSNDLIIK